MENKAIFVDRDGVINNVYIREGKSYPPYTLQELFLLEGVKDAFQMSKDMGFLNIIVTNQPDIANGKQSIEMMEKIHDFIKERVPIDDIFVCLHADRDQCLCRKPLPGMLLSAQEKWHINFKKSFLVGDRWRDIGAAQAVGCESFFVEYNYQEQRPSPPYYAVTSLKEAVEKISNLTQPK